MTHKPIVTVAIPTFNRLELLQRALHSVLNQNIFDLEIIISDNASTDGTRSYLNKITDPRVKILLSNENDGMLANWQRCLLHSNGKYFLLMSDDDALVGDDALLKLVSTFIAAQDQQIGIVFSAVALERPFTKNPQQTRYNKKLIKSEDIIPDFFDNNVSIFPCATLFRTEDLIRIGGYKGHDAVFAVDACAWISVALKYGNVLYLDEPLALYRIHSSLSSSSIDIAMQDLRAIDALIDRNRDKLSIAALKKIKKAINASRARVPLGYIIKKWRHDINYDSKMLVTDILKNKNQLFRFTNYRYIVRRIIRTLFQHFRI